MLTLQRGVHARRVVRGVFTALALVLGIGAFNSAAAQPLRFGADLDGLPRAQSLGLPLAYGTHWVGAWTQRYGWGSTITSLRAAAAAGVTPVVSWWYWGDDITPACVEHGCTDRYHGMWKDRATWHRMTGELAGHIQAAMGGREAIVVIETEFNKNGIETYEPFDGHLTEVAGMLRARGIRVVIGFGNWGQSHWLGFDRAVSAADFLGVQLMRSSVREGTYTDAVDSLVQGVRFLQGTFRKPIIVTDLALSSYPAASFEHVQAQVMAHLFARMPEVRSAGVVAILYRMVVDDPNFDTANYHGVAERHWGLLRADGSQKPAFAVFSAGVQRESAGGAPPTPGCTAPGAPQQFTFVVQGSLVTLRWTAAAGGAPAAYVVEAGTGPGLANLAQVPVAAPLVQVNAPAGTYFVRIRAHNGCGASGASNEQVIRVR